MNFGQDPTPSYLSKHQGPRKLCSDERFGVTPAVPLDLPGHQLCEATLGRIPRPNTRFPNLRYITIRSTLDASHFVFAAFLGSLWCFTRIFLPTPSGRQRYNVLGALNAISHEVVTITNTAYINSQSVVDLLTKLRAQFSELPMTLVLDNAAYQRCALVRDKAAELHTQLLFLPPYSPNLNLIERLWKFVKAQCLNSVSHETFAEFKQAIDDCLTKTATDYKPQLDTLLTLNFQHFKAS